MTGGGDPIETLLTAAREAREGRDRWRKVRPILRALRAAGVPYSRITLETGISRATIHRLAISRRSTTTGR